ncbi:subfamily B ATP-binding cassette protein MsbA [Tenacibaculum skagerrakense]|uniref:Subfamily B ATP-binding cassette protein MsbA n=1 Tax=Tenacibaculum skagerrakense TaxID=186571 RepID=A0A4R2NUL1_9FLAO|nr:ABC transporter ATP-binding protein [Tenacibaculum skagerrakense]TCP25763.1 subfamily B ATP-binding cassette protein MsbA [Tenacibaculum skagerrakense]
MEYFKKILKYANPYKRFAFLNIFFNILYALFSALSFIVIMPLLKVLFGDEKKTEKIAKPIYQGFTDINSYVNQSLSYYTNQIVQEDASSALILVISLIVITFILKNIFSYLAFYYITFLKNGVLKDLRNDLYQKTVSLPISYFSEKRKGDIMARIGNDVIEVHYSFLSILELIFRDPLMIIISISMMLVFSVKLTIFIFIFIPVAGFIINVIGKNLKKTSDKVQYEQGIFLSILDETLQGLKVIKGFTAEKIFNKKFQYSTSRFEKLMNKLMIKTQLAGPVSEILGVTVFCILIWYGGRIVLIDKTIGGETLLGFLGLAYNIITPAKSISKASFTIKKGNAAADRILQILETDDELKDAPNAKSKLTFDHDIEFKNVWFKYQDDYVLEDFSLKIPKGKSVALVGQSGSGKSTLANLITRFYDVTKGEILIDGVNIKTLSKKSLLNLMGIVTQDSILFNDSIKENIKIGDQNATDEEVLKAAKIANAYEFIKDQPKQFETNIGDSGNKLSGGQKQRLSIARAVLKNPPIMILDEATSALDTESEKLVQSALENMMQNRTSMVIAHRLSTIQNADNIVVLHKGEIVEQGKHDELLTKKGEYFKLVTMQNIDS